jgi:hypothetical protein
MVSIAPRLLYPQGKTPGTHWIGGWVGPRAVLDAVVKRKIPSLRRQLNSYADNFEFYWCSLQPFVIRTSSSSLSHLTFKLCSSVLWRRVVMFTEDGDITLLEIIGILPHHFTVITQQTMTWMFITVWHLTGFKVFGDIIIAYFGKHWPPII